MIANVTQKKCSDCGNKRNFADHLEIHCNTKLRINSHIIMFNHCHDIQKT